MIRSFDILFSFIGLILFLPLFLIVSVLIVISSLGGIFYLQNRVGTNNSDFKLIKFRTMYVNSDKSGLLTVGNSDKRITRIGKFLRKYKIDELPQLINVFIGDMSIVGPRPEVRKYVDMYTVEQKDILNIKPGITDYASIIYFNENEILNDQEDPEKYYIETILPEKINLNLKYLNNKNILSYFAIIFKTIFRIFR